MAAMLLSKTKVVHAALACVERGDEHNREKEPEREREDEHDVRRVALRCVVCFVGSTQTQRVLSNRDTHKHIHTCVHVCACICNSGS